MMKAKIILLTLIMTIPVILLASCNGAATTVSASNDLSTATRMALGTLKLEGTSQAVTADQASELLTLWEAYQSLSTSDTSSSLEQDALVNQIEAAMTSPQLESIDTMDLNDQSVSETLASAGNSDITTKPDSTPSFSGLNQSNPAGGPSGAPVGGDGMGVGDILSGVSAQSTLEATQAAAKDTASQQVDPMLLRALIQLLETRSQLAG
jgi:hypothetical protein